MAELIHILAKARQEELLHEAEATRMHGPRARSRLRMPVWLGVQMGTLLIRAGLDLLGRYEPSFSPDGDTCQTAAGRAST